MQEGLKNQAQLLGSIDYNSSYHFSVNKVTNKVTIRQQFTSNMEPLVLCILVRSFNIVSALRCLKVM